MNPKKLVWKHYTKSFLILINLIAFFIITFTQFILVSAVFADVWKADNQWNEEWENRYSQWLSEDVTPTLLVGSGLKADCADLAYALRAIFSREHKLPFMAGASEEKRFGHFSTQWDRYPTQSEWRQDQRFCKFLADLFRDVISTRSLHLDTYPIALNPQTLRPGVMVYEDYLAAHVVIVGQIRPDTVLPITYYESFVPGKEVFFTTQKIEVHLYENQTAERHSGVVRWKWPVKGNPHWNFVPENQIPDYAPVPDSYPLPLREQIGGYLNRIAYEKLYQKPFVIDEVSATLCNKITNLMDQRALRVRQTQELIQRYNLDRLPQAFDQKFNTSTLDQHLFQLIDQCRSWVNGYAISQLELYKSLQENRLFVSQYHPPVLISQLMETYDPALISSSPRDPIQNRWGIKLPESKPVPPPKAKPTRKSRFDYKQRIR